jgi:hypothetical protein
MKNRVEKWNCETAVCPAEGGTPNYARITMRIFIGCKTPFCNEPMPTIVHMAQLWRNENPPMFLELRRGEPPRDLEKVCHPFGVAFVCFQ